jgi:hypothetical protein
MRLPSHGKITPDVFRVTDLVEQNSSFVLRVVKYVYSRIEMFSNALTNKK